MEYTKRLLTARKNAGMSQMQVADALMITQQQYSRYEKGANEIPIRYLIQLCKLLSVSADWVLGLSDNTELNKDNLKKYEITNTVTGVKNTIFIAESITIKEQ